MAPVRQEEALPESDGPALAVSCQVIFNGSIDNVSSLTENVTALLHINEPTCIHTRFRDNLTFLLVNSDSYDKDTIFRQDLTVTKDDIPHITNGITVNHNITSWNSSFMKETLVL